MACAPPQPDMAQRAGQQEGERDMSGGHDPEGGHRRVGPTSQRAYQESPGLCPRPRRMNGLPRCTQSWLGCGFAGLCRALILSPLGVVREGEVCDVSSWIYLCWCRCDCWCCACLLRARPTITRPGRLCPPSPGSRSPLAPLHHHLLDELVLLPLPVEG